MQWARREKMFEARSPTNALENLFGEELEAAWKDWARKEELRRFDHGISSSTIKVLT
jgi:hypothetical protein